jgi:hypothetical protein
VRRFAAFNLFVAFAFTVMADPVSSVAYAIEAALGALDGDLAGLVPTMALVVGTIAVVAASYHQLIARFPRGGGGAEGLAAAFGEGWAFLPLGALLVDFTLTIAVSCAAGASALIAYEPGLAGLRVPLALALAAGVAAGCLLGHRGRVLFATATLAFLALTVIVVVRGAVAGPRAGSPPLAGDTTLLPILFAMPLGMALATGVEAPSNAIAQLGELDDRGRRRFGQLTIWVMLAIVGFLTMAIAVLAVRLGVGEPEGDSTLLADVARAATGNGALFAAFQAASALLLLAAAASSYLAGSGLLEALAKHGRDGDGLLPERLGRQNRWYAPPWGIAALLGAAFVLIAIARGRDQEIVQFYAVAVFASFLGALVACAVLSARDRRPAALAVNVAGIVLVTLVLALNLRRLDPLLSLAAAGVISLYLWRTWVRRGRPGGVGGLGSR